MILIAMDDLGLLAHGALYDNDDDEDAYYMDDDFFDHFSSDDDFEGLDYEESNVLDDASMAEPNVGDEWTVVTNNDDGRQGFVG
jgi:hypothetical protein